MHPTNDFIMELLKYGDQVEVYEPSTLRKAVKSRIEEMIKIYK